MLLCNQRHQNSPLLVHRHLEGQQLHKLAIKHVLPMLRIMYHSFGSLTVSLLISDYSTFSAKLAHLLRLTHPQQMHSKLGK